jgi:peptidoglycan-N-acetylglucosamine deacetylase
MDYPVQGEIRMRKLPILIALIAIIAVVMSGAAPANAQGARTYVVQPGDSLFGIAARFNVSISELATINGVYDVNQVPVGKVLILPNPLPTGGRIPTDPGGSPSQPSQPSQPIQPFTPPVVVYPPGTTVTTVTTYTSYVVRTGDFLASIAQRFGTTPEAIMAANAIANPNLIFVGQVLAIPRTRTTVVPRPRPVVPVVRGRIYIVQPGDNLFSIGARFGRNAWDLARANGILNLNAIYVGQPLIIP